MARAVSKSLAGILEQLEIESPRVVTGEDLATLAREVDPAASDSQVRRWAYELQRRGWLGSLRTRDAWEFYPGARGGSYSAGDRFIEFRAQQATHPGWPGILAMESSASLLGLAQRMPTREVVALPTGTTLPKSMTGHWRSVNVYLSSEATTEIDGLPVWNVEGLIVGIAIRPSGYKDMPGLAQWLSDAVDKADADFIVHLLRSATPVTRQRTAYLLDVGGNETGASAILATYPPKGTAWLGARNAEGSFHSATHVNDTALHPYLSVGVRS